MYPRIVGIFQFMLSTKELAQLVKKDHEVVKYFQVDSVLLSYLEGYYKRSGITMVCMHTFIE